MPRAKDTKPKKKSIKRLPKLNNLTIILIARQYYQQVMPARKSHRILIWVAFFSISIIIAVQMLYPVDRAVPFASITGQAVGFEVHEQLARRITEQFDTTKVKVVAQDKSVEFSLKSAGAEPNTDRIIMQLSDYPFWQRFIPLSLLWQVPKVDNANVYFSTSVLKKFSEEQSKKLSFAPTNARLAFKNETLVATPEIAGSTTTAAQFHDMLVNAELRLGQKSTITAPASRQAAAHPMSEFADVKSQAEAALKRTVAIKANSHTFTPDKKETAGWLVLDTAADEGVTLRVDESRLRAYINLVNTQVGTPPGQTNISIVDGRETGRSTGVPGRAIHSDILVRDITAYVLTGKGKPEFSAQFIDVAPTVIFNSRYTASQEGLQTYLNDLGKTKNVRVMVQQLDGGKWVASTRANESIPSGSTYKLYVALMLFDKMKKGEVSWTDSMLDTNVSTCFNRMTIASTNPCAEKWLADWGRDNVNNFVYAHGFSTGTSFTNRTANHSTAADLNKYMIGLNDGSLVSEPYRSRLLQSLSTHPYRYGIPTGSKGRVYDKVGFLWDYVHDTAIVRHPRGVYVMTIMTKGQSYGAIASITREIERIMYP